MPRRQILPAVLQTVLLITCSLITSHHFWESATGQIDSIELYKNYTNATKLARVSSSNQTQTAQLTLDSGAVNATLTSSSSTSGEGNDDSPLINITNSSTTANGTSSSSTSHNHASNDTKKPFYTHTLPLDIFIYTLISLLNYLWQLTLERALPARPRPSLLLASTSSPKEKLTKTAAAAAAAAGDEDNGDSREEEVVKKWIAQGKVHRASLSWRNTFAKWVLDVVVGGLWMTALYCFLQRLFDSRREAGMLMESFKAQVLLVWAVSLLGSRPLATLAAHIIVPAHKRIVFVAALDLAVWTFIGFFANLLIPWVATTELAQMVVGNMTERVLNGTMTTPRRTDEL